MASRLGSRYRNHLRSNMAPLRPLATRIVSMIMQDFAAKRKVDSKMAAKCNDRYHLSEE
jgi:hypothetical protein